ncbi:hypothetical protein G7Y89_g13287 [Cudoniella acicularis]|uniref:ER membrane protein complex subunit 2 n=1 Tax=Cudoniella acicularis TaxID=354080 RepID=A0A8H4VWK5_9HELO|nr:hypothetical protein G7Y89_g13287 [Cudoniella acicularis]
MSSSLLHPPAHLPPSVALQLSQQAPSLLRNTPSAIYSVSSLWTAAESPELWTTYENLMLSCLRTGDEQSAHLCLERLTERFGSENERLMAFRGLFQEAIAIDDAELKKVLEEYDNILDKDPGNMPVTKRRIALLKTLKKTPEAITALNQLLESSPVDAEAWAELSDLYLSQGMYSQAIFALEEILLATPFAWNVHARLGEVLYVAASASEGGADKHLSESMRRFCRSIELCDDYLRGYYGLKLTTSRLLTTLPQTSRQSKSDTGLPPPDIKSVERLNELATAKLSEIVRRNVSGEAGWGGYDKADIIAAQELLNRDSTPITRVRPAHTTKTPRLQTLVLLSPSEWRGLNASASAGNIAAHCTLPPVSPFDTSVHRYSVLCARTKDKRRTHQVHSNHTSRYTASIPRSARRNRVSLALSLRISHHKLPTLLRCTAPALSLRLPKCQRRSVQAIKLADQSGGGIHPGRTPLHHLFSKPPWIILTRLFSGRKSWLSDKFLEKEQAQCQQLLPSSSSRSTSRSTDSYTDEEGSGVRVPSVYSDDEDDSWELYDRDEAISPSESASRPTSRPRNAPRYRQSESRPPPASRPTRRHTTTERTTARRPPVSRVHRQAPVPPSSVDPLEDYPGYGRGYPAPPTAPFGGRAPGPSYAQSSFSGAPGGFAPPFGGAPGALTHYGQPAPYQYAPPPGNPFSPQPNAGPGGGAGYFTAPPPHHAMSGHNSPAPFPGGHDVMPYGHPGFAGYPGYNMPPGMPPQFMQHFPPQWPPSEPSVVPDPETEKKLLAVEEMMKTQKIDFEKAQQEVAAREAKTLKEMTDREAKSLKEMADREAKALKELADRDAREAAAKAAAEAAKKAAAEKAEWEKKIKDEKEYLEKRNADEKAAMEKKAADEKASLEKKAADEKASLEKKNADEKAAYEKQLADEKAAWEKKVEEEKKTALAKGAENVRKQVEADKKKAEAEAAEAAAKAAVQAELKKAREDGAAEAKRLREEAAAEQKKMKEEAAAAAEKLKKEAEAEQEKLKKEAAEASKAAAEALKKAMAKPEDAPKKPIKFKDAVGRKFSFPFHLCATWAGMEELIKQAFMHVEVIGPHVADGHYDLIGPNGEIILPQVWETMIEPDWSITMHMWPMPEPPKQEERPGPPPGHPFHERPRSRHEARDGRHRGPPPPGPPPPGQRGPPPPPPANWPGPDGRGPPRPMPPPGHERPGPGGEPVFIVSPGREPPPSKSSRRKTEPTKGVLNWMAGKPRPKKAEPIDTCRVM